MFCFQVPEEKKCRVFIDSDTACEADDPYAIAYALMSPKLIVRGIAAEHFAQPGSMGKSLAAARRVTDALHADAPVFPGQDGPEDPAVSLFPDELSMVAEAVSGGRFCMFCS